MEHIYRNTATTEGPPLAFGQQSEGASSQENTEQNSETPIPYILWNNSLHEINLKMALEVVPGTS